MKTLSIPLLFLASLFLAACASDPAEHPSTPRAAGNPFDEFEDPSQPVSRDQFMRAMGE